MSSSVCVPLHQLWLLQVRPPMPPTYLFLIDVSYPAVSSGLTSAACAAILRVLDDIQGGPAGQGSAG